jgi:hypothetical protein
LNATCYKVSTGGDPLSKCTAQCHNNTPPFVLGDYRGLEVDHNFVRGEWLAKITDTSASIIDPNGKTWGTGVIRQFDNQLWLVTAQGTYKGLFGIENTPEVTVLTLAFGKLGGAAPSSFTDSQKNGVTFVFAKCLNPSVCHWNTFQQQVKSLLKTRQSVLFDPISDPCSKYPDCSSCIKAPEYCGWCSVPIIYNNSVVGKNCAGLNTSITPRINCTGTFSTEDCSHQTTSSTGSTSTGHTTGGPNNKKYYCDPNGNGGNGTCIESTNGTLPLADCQAQCTVTPVVPPVLQNKFFRGLEINKGYVKGEWRAHFGTHDVMVVSPDTTVIHGNVTTTANYLTIHTAQGNIQTLWQMQGGPAVDDFTWAWGALSGPAPTSFDSAMTTSGQTEYWYVSCHDGIPKDTCDFSH